MKRNILNSCLVLVFLFTFSKIFSQNNQNNEPKSSNQFINIESAQKSKFEYYKDSTEFILDYFTNYYSNFKKFNFKELYNHPDLIIEIDSVNPTLKELIDTFFKKNPYDNDLAFGDYKSSKEIEHLKKLINIEIKKPKFLRNGKTIQNIRDSIDKMFYSKERIGLELEYVVLNLESSIFYNIIGTELPKIESMIDKIYSNFEKANAYRYIASFYDYYEFDDFAIELYYLALRLLDKSIISDQKKQVEKAEIFENLGSIILTKRNYEYINRGIDYLYKSYSIYLNQKNYQKSNDSWALLTWNRAFCCFYSNFPKNDTNYWKKEIEDVFNNLFNFHTNYINRVPYSDTYSYYSFYSIARILQSYNRNKESIIYHLFGLFYAMRINDYNLTQKSLSDIAFTYIKLGNRDKSLEYQNQAFYLSRKISNYLNYKTLILNSSENLGIIKNYDSANYYANKIFFDTSLRSTFFPPSYLRLMHYATSLKYNAFYNLKSDSVKIYEKMYFEQQDSIERVYSNIFRVDALWNERMLKEEVNDQIENRRIERDSLIKVTNNLQSNARILGAKNKRLESEIDNKTILLDKATSNLTLTTKNFESKKAEIDTLNLKNESLTLQNSMLKDSISALAKDTAFLGEQVRGQKEEIVKGEKEVHKQKKNAKFWSNIGIVALITAVALPLIVGYYIARKKKKVIDTLNKEAERLKTKNENMDLEKKLAEQQLLNDTAISHDIKGLLGEIPAYVRGLKVTLSDTLKTNPIYLQCQSFVEKVYNYFDANYAEKEKLQTTIGKDLQLALIYIDILKISNSANGFKHQIKQVGFTDEINIIEIPKHNLVNFISNAYKHAYNNESLQDVEIVITAIKTNKKVAITIEDNGGGFESLDLETRPKTRGINLVLRQVENYNTISDNRYRINFNKNSIKNIFKNANKIGTQVNYELTLK